MKAKIIEALPIEQMRIVKQIIIVTESRHNYDMSIGYILYERPLSQAYKFKEIPEENRTIDYYINYANQDIYPSDNIDSLILQSVKNTFPKSFVKNHSIIFNVDEENIAILKNRPFENSSIRITPDFRSVDIYSVGKKQFSGLIKDIQIYVDSSVDNIKNLVFCGYYNINEPQILSEIDKVKIL